MTELYPISKSLDRANTHVIFVHGLSGTINQTWTFSSSSSEVFWPPWLEEDIPGVAVWLLGYPAAKTNWGGYGISITDRANNILARLLAEPDLTSGTIVFVSHSLGGLIVEQVLRSAQRETEHDKRAKEFLGRVKKVAFLGTPHRGSFLATIAVRWWMIFRASDATQNLLLGSAQLKDLNYWYRRYSQEKGIQNLLLVEGKPTSVCGIPLPKVIGTTVSEASADGGFQETPIVVDESHTGICKPHTKQSEVYVNVKDFIVRPIDSLLQFTDSKEALEINTSELQRLRAHTERQTDAIAELRSTIENSNTVHGAHQKIIDAEVASRLERIRKCRLFAEFDAIKEARGLITSMKEGDLVLASEEQKGTAFAWCARILCGVAPEEAVEIMDRIELASDEAPDLARSLVKAASGSLEEAIDELCTIGTSVAFGAAYIWILKTKSLQEANEWLHKAGLSFKDLDSDAKFFFIRMSLEDGRWDAAFDAAKEVDDEDCERSPALNFAAADAFLMQTVPEELRTFALTQIIPFEAVTFPLRGDPIALEHRRRAICFYGRLYSVANAFELPGVAGLMDDKALWLRLLDLESGAEARKELEQSLGSPKTFIRRLGLGLQFGVEIDIAWAEQEVDRQTARSGSMSPDVASARFALALNLESPADVASYIDVHRQQLLKHLDWRGIYFVEIRMLAGSGQFAKAEERLNEATEKGLSEREITRVRHELAEVSGSDPIAERLAAYEEGESIVDLRILVMAYVEAEDWSNACVYGRKLLDASGDLADARQYVISSYNFEQHDEVLRVMETYPALWAKDNSLQILRVQILFEIGKLDEALAALRTVREYNDSSECRQLQINLAIASGDWESLQGFVEDEWNARSDRTDTDLLRAGQIARHIGAVRGKELVREAAARSIDDPEILAGCYQVASSTGWEGSTEVHSWIERAAQLSDGDGPVQMISIEDIFEWKPNWEQREAIAWKLLEKGDTPVFVAGESLNQSLLSLYLMPALNNLNEPDIRRKSMIYAFSGSRERTKVQPRVVAMDATALITTEFLDLLDVCIEEFESIVIPHCTLGWLLGEKARVLFHQPSRVVAARELRRMIAEGHLRAFEGSNVASERLVNEVGSPLATFIAEASNPEHRDARQRLVVRGGPVYKANSLMQEEANLSDYEPYICSATAVVKMLSRKGFLTSRETKEACAALNVREVKWPSEPQIGDEAVLYLDDLAVSHLQHLNLLSKLHLAGITVFVSSREIEKTDALISYDETAGDVVEIVERLRLRVREGLGSGKVRLGKATRSDDDKGSEYITSHPTIDILRLMADADVGVVDDRFVNQHTLMSLGTTNRPLLTTVDLLNVLAECGSISGERRRDALTRLRQANFVLTPLTAEELNTLIVNCAVSGETLEETAEIKAIREGIERVRMSNMLQLPKELTWLNGINQTCLICLKEQWKEGFNEATAVARSDWLLELSDLRAWTHRLNENVEQLKERYRNWIMLLMILPAIQQQQVKDAYWRWFDSRVLKPFQEEEPDTYQFLLESAKERVTRIVDSFEQGLEDRNKGKVDRRTLVGVSLESLPPRVRSSLLDDKEFVRRWSLTTIAGVTFGRDGPSFQRDRLYGTIRKAICAPRKEFAIEDDGKVTWRIKVQDENEELSFVLQYGERTLSIPDHSGLAEDHAIRMNWFRRVTDEAMLKAEILEDWKAKIDSRPLSDEEFTELIRELELTPVVNYLNIQKGILQGSVDLATLVPGERRYYDRLVAPCDSAVDANGYIESEVVMLIDCLQEWDSTRGFLMSLLMCSKGKVSEYIRIDGLDEEQLLRSYEWIADQGDPISQIGAVEVALRHIDTIPALEPFIERIIEGFIEDDANDNNGWFSLLSAMIVLVASELSRRGIMKDVYPFYRRQAAIAQASLIVRAIKKSQVDRVSIVEWARTRGVGYVFFMQGLVDLRLEPRWLPDFVNPNQLRAEFIGRVANAVRQYEGKIQSKSLCGLLIGEDSRLAEAVEWPFPMLPGPLEGELTPDRPSIPDKVFKEVAAGLEADHLEPSSFAGFVNMALLYRIPASQAGLAATALRRVRYSIENTDDENSIFYLIGGLANVAAVTRATDLAETLRVLARVMRRRKRLNADIDDEIRIAMVAAASHEELEDWAQFAGDWITELAFEVIDKDSARSFLLKLRRLVHIEPALARHCAVACAALASVAR